MDPEPAVAETVTRSESRPGGAAPRSGVWEWVRSWSWRSWLSAGSAVVDEAGATPSPLSIAYQALDQGEPDKAKALFQQQVEGPEPRTRSQAYTGLAVVALAAATTSGPWILSLRRKPLMQTSAIAT